MLLIIIGNYRYVKKTEGNSFFLSFWEILGVGQVWKEKFPERKWNGLAAEVGKQQQQNIWFGINF